MKNIVVAIVSSELTYPKLNQLLFNDNFLKNRDRFDIAVVFNSNKKIDMKFKTHFDYVFYRENTGFDLGGFNLLLKNLNGYEYYFLLHDDNFYQLDNWIDYSIQLLKDNPDVDIIGNILFNNFDIDTLNFFKNFIEKLNYSHLIKYAEINNTWCFR